MEPQQEKKRRRKKMDQERTDSLLKKTRGLQNKVRKIRQCNKRNTSNKKVARSTYIPVVCLQRLKGFRFTYTGTNSNTNKNSSELWRIITYPDGRTYREKVDTNNQEMVQDLGSEDTNEESKNDQPGDSAEISKCRFTKMRASLSADKSVGCRFNEFDSYFSSEKFYQLTGAKNILLLIVRKFEPNLPESMVQPLKDYLLKVQDYNGFHKFLVHLLKALESKELSSIAKRNRSIADAEAEINSLIIQKKKLEVEVQEMKENVNSLQAKLFENVRRLNTLDYKKLKASNDELKKECEKLKREIITKNQNYTTVKGLTSLKDVSSKIVMPNSHVDIEEETEFPLCDKCFILRQKIIDLRIMKRSKEKVSRWLNSRQKVIYNSENFTASEEEMLKKNPELYQDMPCLTYESDFEEGIGNMNPPELLLRGEQEIACAESSLQEMSNCADRLQMPVLHASGIQDKASFSDSPFKSSAYHDQSQDKASVSDSPFKSSGYHDQSQPLMTSMPQCVPSGSTEQVPIEKRFPEIIILSSDDEQ